jgi:hypothetical protein
MAPQFRQMSAGAAKAEGGLAGHWLLSDPGAYPVLAIIVGASLFAGTQCLRTLLKSPDVRIDKAKRQTVIRYW